MALAFVQQIHAVVVAQRPYNPGVVVSVNQRLLDDARREVHEVVDALLDLKVGRANRLGFCGFAGCALARKFQLGHSKLRGRRCSHRALR
jgi:hypothetical protein